MTGTNHGRFDPGIETHSCLGRNRVLSAPMKVWAIVDATRRPGSTRLPARSFPTQPRSN